MKTLLEAIQHSVQVRPKEIAFKDLDSAEDWTWENLWQLTNFLVEQIGRLKLQGVYPVLCVRQNIFLPAGLITCWRCNLCPILIGEDYTEQELLWLMEAMGERSLILFAEEEIVLQLKKKINHVDINFFGLQKKITDSAARVEVLKPEDSAVGLITSGSLSRPKTVIFSHENLFRAAVIEQQNEQRLQSTTIWNLRPPFVSGGLNSLWPSFFGGTTTNVLSEKFRKLPHARFLFPELEKVKPSLVIMSPAYIKTLVKTVDEMSPLFRQTDLYFGGMSLSEVVIKKLIEKNFFPSMRYGMTEVGHIISKRQMLEGKDDKPSKSMGRAYSNFKIKLQNGKLALSSPGVASFYFWQGERVPLSVGGWFTTDDSGELSEENEIYLYGREQEIICIDGFRFHNSQVEKLVESFGIELDFKLLGFENSKKETTAVAFCVNQSKDQRNEELEFLLKKLFEEKLPPYKRPQKYLWLQGWPYFQNGKLNLNFLRQFYLDQSKS